MRELYPGNEGTLVRYLQLALQRAGQDIQVDGVFGPKTCEALEKMTGGTCVAADAQWEMLLPYLRGYVTHTVEEGDSLYQLAEKYDTTVEAIERANPGINAGNLNVGTIIVVPYAFPLVAENVPYSSLLVSWIIEGLQARYPYVQTGKIGNSVMGTPISYLKLGNGATEVAYNASFHANESITTPVLLKFAEQLLDAYAQETTYGDVYPLHLFEEFSLYLVPLVNPDGVDLVNGILDTGRFYRQAVRISEAFPQIPFPDGWKANIDGTDLNLQFPAGWEEAKKIKYAQGYSRPAPRDFVGPTPLSAPESIAMYQFTRSRDFALILAYHTQGEVIYWRFLDYNPAGSRKIAQYFSSVSGYRVEETPLASGYAGYKDWFIQDYDRPGYTIEAGLGTNPLPMEQFPKIYADNIGILFGGMTQLE